jgi:hypothetical protein
MALIVAGSPAEADARLDDAIARRNVAWARFQEARARLEWSRSTPAIADYNAAQDAYEHAARDLIRARVAWRADTGRDLVTGLPIAH